MSHLHPAESVQIGQRLYTEGFQPLPDVTDDGVLIGTILWRQNGRHVEYLALRTNGFALAMTAEARFNYRTPHLHGPVIDFRSGHVGDALDWLLAAGPHSRLPWVGSSPQPHGQHHLRDDDGDHQ